MDVKKQFYLIIDGDHCAYSAMCSTTEEFFELCKKDNVLDEYYSEDMEIVLVMGNITREGFKLTRANK